MLDFTKEKWWLALDVAENKPVSSINPVFNQDQEKRRSFSAPRNNAYAVITVDDPSNLRFFECSREEIEGLLDRRAYVVVSGEYVPCGSTFLRSRVLQSIKEDLIATEKFKTRLVILGLFDPGKWRVVNEAYGSSIVFTHNIIYHGVVRTSNVAKRRKTSFSPIRG